MSYDLTSIKMNIDLGDTKKVIAQYNSLIKSLETKHVTLNIDVSKLQSSVSLATKEIEKVYQQDANAKAKAEKDKSDAIRQTHESAMKYLRQQQEEIQKTYNASSKLTYNQDPKTGQITSAMISFTNEVGKAETKMYQLKESMEKLNVFGQEMKMLKLDIVNQKNVDDTVKINSELEKIATTTQKVRDTMGNKVSSATLGIDWSKELDSYKKFQDAYNSFKPTSMEEAKKLAYDLTQLYKQMQQEIAKVKLDNKLNQDLEKVAATVKKVNDGVSNKIASISLGKEWVKDLDSVKQLKDMVNSFNPKNMEQAKKESYEIAQALKKVKQEVDKVKLGEKMAGDITKAQEQLDSFVSSMNQKLANITIGKDGDWATKLSQFQQLQSEMANLSSMQANGANLDEIATQIDKVNALYAQTTTEITRVNQLNKEMNSSNAFDQNITNKVRDYNTQLEILRNKYDGIESHPLFKTILSDVTKLNNAKPTEFANSLNVIDNNLKKIKAEMSSVGKVGDSIFTKLGNSIKSAFSFISGSMVIYKLANEIRQIPEEVRKLDTALVDLKKTTTMSNEELDRFYISSNEIAKQLGVTTKEVIEQAGAWSRLGYSTKEQAETMSKVSSIFKSISPNMGMDKATDGLVSTMKAFNIEANDALDGIVSKINVIGNTQAISNSDIVEFLTRSSSAMAEANNSLEETIALGTAAVEITRDAASVGQILKTTSMRIRGYSEETEAYTEDVTVLSGKIADLTKTAKNMSGISLFTDETRTEYKSTYKLLEEISGIYDELSDKQQADLLEALAGKRNGQAIAAIINNFSAAQKSIESMASSQGNAMREMEIIYDSIDYKLNNLRETWVGISQDFLNRDMFKSLIDGAKGILDIIDSCGGLEQVLLSVATAFALLKTSSLYLTHGSIVGGIKNIINELFVLKEVANKAGVAVMGLSMAQKALVGGLVVVGVMGIGAILKELSKGAEDAKEKLINLKKEIGELKKESENKLDLAKQFEDLSELSKKYELGSEKQQEFYDIQNKLKELMPELSGYYDEQGNFIVTETNLVKDLTKSYKELLEEKNKQKQATMKEILGNAKNEYDDAVESAENYKKKVEELQDIISGKKSSAGTLYAGLGMDELEAQLIHMIGMVNNALTSQNKKLADTKNELLSYMYDTKGWTNLTKEQQDAIKEFIASLSPDEIFYYTEAIRDGEKASEGLVEEISKEEKVIDAANKKIEEAKNKLGGLGDATDGVTINIKELSEQFNSVSSDISTLEGVIAELNEGNGLTASSIQSIIDKAPELLGFIGDETQLKQKLIEKTEEARKVQEETLKYIAFLQSETFGEMERVIKTYFDELGIAYDIDFSNYKSLEEAKLDVTARVVKQIAKMYSDLFSSMSSIMSMELGGYSKVTHIADIDPRFLTDEDMAKMKAVEDENKRIANEMAAIFDDIAVKFDSVGTNIKTGGGKGSSKGSGGSSKADDKFKRDLDRVKKYREDIEREIEELEAAMKFDMTLGNFDEDKMNKMTELIAKLKDSSQVQISGNGDFKGYEQLKQIYKSQEELAELESLIADARKTGYTDQVGYYEHLIELIDRQQEVEQRAYDDKIWYLEMEQERHNEDSKEYQDIEQQKLDMLIQMQESYKDKIRLLKEQGLSDEQEDVRRYIDMWRDAEEERLSMTRSMAEQIRKARLSALDVESKKYSSQKESLGDLLDITKDMIKKESAAKISSIESEYKAREEALKNHGKDVENAMKKEMDDRIEAHKKETQLRNEAIKSQLDGYKRIIDAKKKALKDEQNDRNYNKGLTEKQKKIKDIEDKLLALELDTSLKAQAEKKKLEDELLKYKSELEDYQYDNSIKQQEEALDEEWKKYEETRKKELDAYNKQREEELAAYKKQKQAELDAYKRQKDAELSSLRSQKEQEVAAVKKQTETEGALRKKAMEYLKKEGKGAYDALLKYAMEYTDMSKEEFDEMWSKANEAIDKYSGTSMSLIDIMKALADEMKRVADESERIKNQSWTEFAPDKGSTQVGGGSSSGSTSSGGSSGSSSGKPSSGGKTESQAKSQAQSEQQRYLHNQMVEAKKSNNTGLISWIKSVRPKYGLNPETGAIAKSGYIDPSEWNSIKKKYGFMKGGLTNSTGLHWLDGEVGKPERVLSAQQTKSFDDMVKHLPNFNNIMKNVMQGNGNPITVQIDKIMDVANIEKDVDIESLVNKATDAMYKSLNNVFKLNGMSPMR